MLFDTEAHDPETARRPRRPAPAEAGAADEPAAPAPDEPALPAELTDAIARTWGIRRLRPLQAKAMAAALEGRDLVLVLPTGGGKSLCYQAPALVREGLTIVVSPLIALMKDQVDGLLQNGVAAGMLTSAQDAYQRREVHEDLDRGRLKLLFVAPERLMVEGFLDRLAELGVAGVAIDEAHCISHWGHDFRPEYRQLGELRRKLPGVPIAAFTATATERVRRDVAAQLALRDPLVLVGPCDRPNLTYRVRARRELGRQVLEVVRRHAGRAGIVYCISRREVEALADELRAAGVRAAPYHAGLDPDTRRRTQDAFIAEDLDVVVATVAFGMGIDRTDVRFVVHAALPKGIEQYGQETGRAGRDGLPSECVLFWSGADFHAWRSLFERAHAEAAEAGGAPDRAALDAQVDRLGKMVGFATRLVCRHRQLVEHFGQRYEPPAKSEDGRIEDGGAERSGAEHPGVEGAGVEGAGAEHDGGGGAASDARRGGGCGACDVCLGEIEALEDSTTVAQMILSCVVRCEQRYGAGHVADVLRGADTAGIRRAGHDRLSTHGLLRDRTAPEIRGWIDQLVGQGHLLVDGGRYPTLCLSRSGVRVMRGEEPITLFRVPRPRGGSRRAPAAAPVALEAPADAALFETLRALRRELARERQVPPYLVFNDRTLAEMAAVRPATQAELLEVKGVGEKKAAEYGERFLEAIAEHAEPAS